MAINAKDAFQLVKRSAKDFGDDECPRMAAALAYYTVFALPPLLILILMLVSAFVSRDQVQAALSGEVGRMMGGDGARMVLTMITQAKQPGGGPMGTILGIGALVLGATGAFLQLQAALNRAWEVEPDPEAGGLKNFITKRVLSLGMVLGIAFLLLVSLALSAALSAVGHWIGALIPGGSQVVAWIVGELVAITVVFLLFAAIFKVLPDAEIAWKDVWVGALVTAVLFEVGKAALGIYLGNSNPGKAYGAAGSLAVILVWIYYSAMIVLFGAEFTQTWATTRGEGIRPEEGAVAMADDAGDASRPRAAATERARGSRREGDRDRGARTTAIPRQEPVSTPAQVSERAMAAAKRDREPEHTPENERGLPGGGVGRREAVGGSGIHPVSAGDLPKGAEPRAPGQIAEPRRREDDVA
ncbi:MAG TPA: YihY/virulence factor BrkB family protein [Longimicrobium sp.]